MDRVVTNSQHIRQLLLDLTGVDSTVVYPPTNLTRFHWLGQGEYYLSLGRLEPNKQVDWVIRAFRQMPEKKLVVASGGSQLGPLKALSKGALNIQFTDWLDETSLVNLIGNSIACLYIPRDEDFGMSAVEAMAAGKPVIGVDEGGLKEIIVQNLTGFLLPKDLSIECICYAVRMLDSDVAAQMRGDCEDRAKLFSLDLFISRMTELIHVENSVEH
jgi:glycosyltransferase involved in cell wall biosynthesis